MVKSFDTCSIDDLADLCASWGEKPFRAKQIVQWVYGKGAQSYGEMTNLSKKLREKLACELPLHIPVITDRQISNDGTRKYLLELADGAFVETVGIPSRDATGSNQPRRLTVCFSTQVGCPMACAFCATGKQGFTRNLEPGEIVQQVLAVSRDFGMRVTNAVGMGQGEPFLNFDNVLAALRIMNHRDALDIGARHITVSTCGISSGIAQFAAAPEQFTLALSLHAAIQSTRDSLMPRSVGTTLEQLHRDIEQYWNTCKRRVTLEYLLIKGVNDSPEHREALISFCETLHAHINLLSLNEISGSPWHPVSKRTANQWLAELTQAGIETSFRDSRGSDIAAACGQLANTR